MFKDKFLNALVDGKIDNETELIRSFEHYKIKLGSSYRALSIRIDTFRKVTLALDENEKQILLYKMMEIIKNKFHNIKHCVFSHDFNSIVIIISTDILLDELINIANEIRDDIYYILKIKTTTGIGRNYINAREITISYLEAEGALKYRYYLGYFTVIPIEFVEPNNYITYRYPKDKEEKLIYSAIIGEYEYCNNLLNELMLSLKNAGEVPTSILPKIIMTIIISISKYAEEQKKGFDYDINSFFDFAHVIKIDTIDLAYEYLHKFLQNFCQHATEIRINGDIYLFENTKKYIDDHYFETFTLTGLAKMVSTSPEYLNNLFCAKTQKSIHEYTLSRRMEEAKKIMRETNKDDVTISGIIGFDNPRYFRSIFELNENITTIEYRRKYGIFFK